MFEPAKNKLSKQDQQLATFITSNKNCRRLSRNYQVARLLQVETTVSGCVARGVDHIEAEPGEIESLAMLQRCRSCRTPVLLDVIGDTEDPSQLHRRILHQPVVVRVQIRRHRELPIERAGATDVVDVAMCQQQRNGCQLVVPEHVEQRLWIGRSVDDHRWSRLLGSHDVGVRLGDPEGDPQYERCHPVTVPVA